MKNIKLLNLKLTNFKGIKSFDLSAQGNDLKVFGGNATGKTTLFDAFVWLLFDKDSNNRSTSAFDIKTLVDGKAISKINHEVEASLDIDGQPFVLKKVYKEKWAKKRGSSTDDFTGHTTDYYINEVPSKKKEYDEAINKLVNEDVFKLLTSPTNFNQALTWKERRDLLIELSGDITDEDVVSTDKDLEKLLEVLKGNSIEDHKKIIAAKRRDINKEIDRIPIRIDEINRNLPDTNELKESDINNTIKKLDTEIKAKNEQINSIKNGSEVVEVKKQISELEIELNKVKANHESEQKEELHKLETKLTMEKTNLDLLRDSVRPNVQNKKLNTETIASNVEKMNLLRINFSEFTEDNKKHSDLTFDKHSLTCPTCSQELPEANKEDAEAKFNKDKSNLIESNVAMQDEIQVKGKALAKENEELQLTIEGYDKEIEKITKQAETKTNEIERITKQVKSAKELVQPVDENLKVIQLNKEIKELKEKVMNADESSESEIKTIENSITELEGIKESNNVDLNKLEQVKQSSNRITELEEEERKLASEFEQLEHQLFLTEEFTRKKVNMLTEKINSKFKYARFNLFKENINGGLEEVCETTYNGVPFDSGLNNAAKTNVGLDIINTLSEHYGVQAPIFVDNAESVTDLINVKSQLISLIVSEKDKELRIEKTKEMEVA